MLILLAVALFFLIAIEYIIFCKDLVSPAILFSFPFLVMTIIAIAMKSTWHLSLEWNTLLVIIVGNMAFLTGTVIGKRIKGNRFKSANRLIIDPIAGFERWKGVAFIVYSMVCYLWKTRQLIRFSVYGGYGATISEALRYYDFVQKRDMSTNISWPALLNYMLHLQDAIGYVWACLLAYTFTYGSKKKGVKQVILINFVISVIGSLTSGGRGASIKYIISFVVALIFLHNQKNGWSNKIPIKYLVAIVFVGIITIIGFLQAASFVGRSEIGSIQRYLTNYMGAQLYNLNLYLNEGIRRSQIYGQETFYNLLKSVGGWIGNDTLKYYSLDHPSIYINGVSLGNVYTTFYAYIHDFGYAGVLIMPLISGFISQRIYLAARHQSTIAISALSMPLTIYSYIGYMLVFSFFSNKFYELFTSISMIRMVFWTLVIYYILFGLNISGLRMRVSFRSQKQVVR